MSNEKTGLQEVLEKILSNADGIVLGSITAIRDMIDTLLPSYHLVITDNHKLIDTERKTEFEAYVLHVIPPNTNKEEVTRDWVIKNALFQRMILLNNAGRAFMVLPYQSPNLDPSDVAPLKPASTKLN